MCGINGIYSKKYIGNACERVDRMNQSLVHRGPDAGGVKILTPGHIVFGHRRLSVIDLNIRSDQPMCTSDGSRTIVYNGEIYNFKELRAELEFPFMTNSDTEVLLAGLTCCGMEWIKKTNGMFAFAYYDSNDSTIILGRDRMGIKPLYYYHDDDYFVFSSEIKGILQSGLINPVFNEDVIDEYLGNRYIREPYTFFKNIYQVPSGCCLILDANRKIRIERYWDLPDSFNMDPVFDEDSIYNEFKDNIFRAINRRMIADVPLGTYLSGGVDSSLISAICSEYSTKPVNTYTIGFPSLNEFPFARQVADQYETVHHEILMDHSDYFSKMKELILYKDAPLGVPNEIPLALMSKVLKKDITVVLSGEGADELMGGYGRIFRSPFDYEHVDFGKAKTFYDYFIEQYEYVPRKMRDRYLKTGHPIRDDQDRELRRLFTGRKNEENVFRFFHEFHVKGLLQRVDITTMYASVEARVPFLDHELIEFTYRNVPYDLKLKWGSEEAMKKAESIKAFEYSERLDTPKYLLRRLGRELLPEPIITRKKVGFPVPLNEWFDNLQHLAKEYLSDADWLQHTEISSLLVDCRNNVRAGQLLWMFVNIEMFRRLYFSTQWVY